MSESREPESELEAIQLVLVRSAKRSCNFMLCSAGGRSYAFVHRTFLEYFCAVEICQRFQIEQTLTFSQLKMEIFGHWADESWHEVLCLLAGMIATLSSRKSLNTSLAAGP